MPAWVNIAEPRCALDSGPSLSPWCSGFSASQLEDSQASQALCPVAMSSMDALQTTLSLSQIQLISLLVFFSAFPILFPSLVFFSFFLFPHLILPPHKPVSVTPRSPDLSDMLPYTDMTLPQKAYTTGTYFDFTSNRNEPTNHISNHAYVWTQGVPRWLPFPTGERYCHQPACDERATGALSAATDASCHCRSTGASRLPSGG